MQLSYYFSYCVRTFVPGKIWFLFSTDNRFTCWIYLWLGVICQIVLLFYLFKVQLDGVFGGEKLKFAIIPISSAHTNIPSNIERFISFRLYYFLLSNRWNKQKLQLLHQTSSNSNLALNLRFFNYNKIWKNHLHCDLL